MAVGDCIYHSSQWKTFHDFLCDYIKITLGSNWGNTELKKIPEERHSIIKWYVALCHLQKRYIKEKGKIYSGICTGKAAAYLSLAYDLYVLRHHSLLQKSLVKRLKIRDQFQGARYELYVAASFIRSNFDIEYEDETDRSSTHCEFLAIHKVNHTKYSVEAKSRHRAGHLGRPGEPKNPENIRLRVGKLLRDALKKQATDKRIIFVDVNMPPEDVAPCVITWFKPLMNEIEKIEKEEINGDPTPTAYIFITNHPYHYVGEEKPDPAKNFMLTAINEPNFMRQSDGSIGMKDPNLLLLWDTIYQHSTIPNKFDS